MILKKKLAASALAFALAASTIAFVPTQEADAVPQYAISTTFFSDASHSTAVGIRELTCSGGNITIGTVTNFKSQVYTPCY